MNFKNALKEKLLNPNTKNEIIKEIYLIDKEWFEEWKIHVGYREIKEFYKKFMKKKQN